MNRPVIGISAAEAPVKVAIFDIRASFVPQQFTDRVVAAGGVPVLLPPQPGIERALRGLDGLLILAGPDVDPELYSAERHPKTVATDPARDAAEMALMTEALASGLPFLGICRAMQLLNVLRGGTLHQHLPDLIGHTGHLPDPKGYGPQRVRLDPGSHIAKIMGGESATVPCHHHQITDRLGAGLTPTAWAEEGFPEVLEADDHPFGVTVQWHAEESEDDRPFLALTEAARARAAAAGRL